jgi:hypothetical protein
MYVYMFEYNTQWLQIDLIIRLHSLNAVKKT